MNRAAILAVGVLLLVPGMAEAEGRPAFAIEADIAAVDGKIRKVQKRIEEGGSADARMQTALEECDRLDAIYARYRKRLVAAQDAVNAAHRAYKEQFRLASVMGPCNAQTLWWEFCNLPYVEDFVGWKTCGPYKKSLKKTHDEFIATRTAYHAEKRAVATELPRDQELLTLGLGAFDDYFAFKRAYVKRKADCDATVRPYFRDRKSFVQLQGELEELRQRRAELEEELAATRGPRQPAPATEEGATGGARIQVLWPRPADLQRVPLQDDVAGAKGLPFRAQVVSGAGIIEPGRLYRFVAQLGRQAFTVYGRGQAAEAQGPPILALRAILPAGLGPFQLRLSAPDVGGIRAVTVSGRLVPNGDGAEALATAQEQLTWAGAPRPDTDRLEVQRDLARVYCDIAMAQMRLDRMEDALRMARKVETIVKREWPASKAWRKQKDSTWGERAWIFTQDALARRDIATLEKIQLARAEIYRELGAEARQRGKEGMATTFGIWRCDAYRDLSNLIVLLTDDVERARKHWRTGRDLMPSEERVGPRKPDFDPAWFSR